MLGPILLISFMLSGMAWIIQTVRLLELIAGQTDSVLIYFGLPLLTLPRMLTFVLPISLFCGIIWAFTKLMQHSELIIMLATGQSRWQLAKPAMILAVISGLIIGILNLWLSPLALQELRNYRVKLQNDLARILIKEGTFHNPATRLTIHSIERKANGIYGGLVLHDARRADSILTYIAREGTVIKNENGVFFLLIDGTIYGMGEKLPPKILHFEQYVYDLDAVIEPPVNVDYELKERYLTELLTPNTKNENFKKNAIALGHNHIADMFQTLILTLICLAAVLTDRLDRRSQNRRILVAANIAIIYKLAGFGVLSVASRNNDMIWLIYALPIGSFILATLWFHTMPNIQKPLHNFVRRNFARRGQYKA